jgi:hypothetical protein
LQKYALNCPEKVNERMVPCIVSSNSKGAILPLNLWSWTQTHMIMVVMEGDIDLQLLPMQKIPELAQFMHKHQLVIGKATHFRVRDCSLHPATR